MLTVLIIDHVLRQQPGDQVVPILDRGGAEGEMATNLGAMVLDRAPVPVIPRILLRCHLDLSGNMGDNGAGNIVLVLGEPAFSA